MSYQGVTHSFLYLSVLNKVAFNYYMVNTLSSTGSINRRLRLVYSWVYTCLLALFDCVTLYTVFIHSALTSHMLHVVSLATYLLT